MKKETIFIFSTHCFWPNHKETELELIQQSLNENKRVIRFVCDGIFPACDINLSHNFVTCLRCIDSRIIGQKLLKGNIIEYPIISKQFDWRKLKKKYNFPFTNIKDLQNLTFQNFDLGYAVLSTLISHLREPDPNIELHKELIENLIYSSLSVYLSCLNWCRVLNPSKIIIFNGRLAHVKPILRVAQSLQIECIAHERGSSFNKYELYYNTTPHDRVYILERMQNAWNAADGKSRISIAKSFFEERVKGKAQGWVSFVKEQKIGKLPERWDKHKTNITIFNSSEDEFASIGKDWENDLFKTQFEGIKLILEKTINRKDIHFYLRIHPNLKGILNSEIRLINSLSFPNLTIIKPDDEISSYELLFNSDKIITFGSSVGIEAVYWGIPSIQIGKSFYYGLNATYKPQTVDELVNLIVSIIPPLPQLPALIYGFYFKTFGIPFNDYKPSGFFEGTYKGKNLSKETLICTKIYLKLRSFLFINIILLYLETKYQENKSKFYLKFKF